MSKHIINLEDYKTDGSKTGANNPFLSTPNNITHCQLRYEDDSQDEVSYQGVFVLPNTVSFDVDAPLGSLFKLYESSDGVTYTENTAFGGNDGVTLPLESGFLDADDFTDYQIPALNPDTGLIEPMDLQDVIDGAGVVTGGGTAPYYVYTNTFFQDNATSSGKIRVSAATIQNSVSSGTSLSRSSKTGTGIYLLQFRSTINGTTEDSFRTEIANSPFSNSQWEQVEKTILDSSKNIIGKAIFGTNFAIGDFDLGEGRIEIRTYNTSGVLADDILIYGITVSIKSYVQILTDL